jgi:hypothetical protein
MILQEALAHSISSITPQDIPQTHLRDSKYRQAKTFSPQINSNITQDNNTHPNENTNLEPYITRSMVYYQAWTRSCIIIGPRCVVTNRLSFAVCVDPLKTIMILLLLLVITLNMFPTSIIYPKVSATTHLDY